MNLTTRDYIGGPMEFDPTSIGAPDSQNMEAFFHLDKNCFLPFSGRSAFATALDEIIPANGHILIPDFICGDVMFPRMHERRTDFQFYSISTDLSIDENTLWAALEKTPKAILLINYFGICDWTALAQRIRTSFKDVLIIADNVQALYDTSAWKWADFTFSSFRKFLPVPDGGIARARQPISPTLETPEKCHLATHITAANLRHVFLNNTFSHDIENRIEQMYLDLFQDASQKFPSKPMSMSSFSQQLVKKMPLQSFAERRIANYHYLSGQLSTFAQITLLRPTLNEHHVPMTLPVLAPDGWRDEMVSYLRDHRIFCPIHWPLADAHMVKSGPHCQELARRIFSVPIDQRYKPSSLARVAATIKSFCKKRKI